MFSKKQPVFKLAFRLENGFTYINSFKTEEELQKTFKQALEALKAVNSEDFIYANSEKGDMLFILNKSDISCIYRVE